MQKKLKKLSGISADEDQSIPPEKSTQEKPHENHADSLHPNAVSLLCGAPN